MVTATVALKRTQLGINSSILRMREQDRLRQQQRDQQTSLSSLKTNAIFNHRYEIVRTLQDIGGMAKMFVAFDPVSLSEVILKTTDISLLNKYYQAETDVLKKNLHPMFPTHIESGQCGDVRFIAMEKIDGITLKALIQREQPIPLHQAIDITMSVLYGLKHLHQDGERVHRDIKPDNIMLEHSGAARLIDFGLAVAKGHQEEEGMVVGTPAYLSPEQARAERIRHNSDIYSLGLVLYEMMTKYNPAKNMSPIESIHNHMRDEHSVPALSQGVVEQRIQPEQRESLSQQIEQAHQQLNIIIQRMTAKDATARYQEVDEVIEQLENLRAIAEELRPYEQQV